MAPKAKSSASGNEKGGTSSKASTPGATTPVSTIGNRETSETTTVVTGSGKPDKKVYDQEQERIKTEIDALNLQLSTVREKIAIVTSKSGPGNDQRSALRAELDTLRGQQSSNKASRGKILDQLKALQETVQKKVKDLQNAKSKMPFKSVADIDNHIKSLEKQVETGSMKVADEKRALNEIQQCRRNRRTVEGFQAEQDVIDADRQKIEGLRKQLDDPDMKALSERFDAIKAELDDLKKDADEAFENRSKLFEERDALQAQLNTLHEEKRDSSRRFREANDRYWNKINEDRARRAERARAQRAAEEAQKKQEIADRLREEAAVPAFQAQIEDCQTLIDFFSSKQGGNSAEKTTLVSTKAEVAGVPKLELRKVDPASMEGLVARKKKGEDEAYFVGGKGRTKNKKGTSKANSLSDASPSSIQLHVPLPTLTALLSLSIPPPASSAEIPRVIGDLQTKKAWFEANQRRVTEENIAKAEAEIARLTNSVRSDKKANGSPTAQEIIPPNGGEENLAELMSTPDVGDPSPTTPSGDDTINKLEVVQSQQADS